MSQGFAAIANPPVGISGNQYTTLLNTNLAALVTKHSGTTAPGTPSTFQDWVDTSGSIYIWKVYDGTDWIIKGYINPTLNLFLPALMPVINDVSTSYSVLSENRERLVTLNNASPVAVSLPQAGVNFPDGWRVVLKNKGAGLVTITPVTSTIDALASITLTQGESCVIQSDGSNYHRLGRMIVPAATESVPGIMELANQSEVNTGTDDARAVTALKLAAWDLTSNKRFDPIFNSVSDSSGTITLDLNNGDNFECTLSGTGRTLANPSNMREGAIIDLRIVQDGSGGRTITSYGGYWSFPEDEQPEINTAIGAVGHLIGIVKSSTLIEASYKSGF